MWNLLLSHALTVFGVVLGITIISRVLRQSSRPGVSFSWLMAIVFVPYIGVPAYLLFGGRKLSTIVDSKEQIHTLTERRIDHHPSLLASVVDNVLTASDMAPARKDLAVEFLPEGDTTYARLMELINGAERTIHVMTYILGKDEVGREIVDALTRKAAEGIEVRLLLDAWGCRSTKGKFVDGLRDAGGRVGIFMPYLPVQRQWSANLRNHRKLMVVDGNTALMGGMNLAREYMGPTQQPDRWIDTAAIIRGRAALDLDDAFLNDWKFATGESAVPLEDDVEAARAAVGEAVGQVALSGPNVSGDPLYEAILTATFEVQERLWIVTPYFVPDEALIRALRLQARLGRDVRIVVPDKSNHFFADVARGRALRELHHEGVRIFYHSGRMIHAKHLVFDNRIAVIGSINFDMRSLYLNYEVAMFLYTRPEVDTISKWMEEVMETAEEKPEAQAGYIQKLAEDITQLVSPLL